MADKITAVAKCSKGESGDGQTVVTFSADYDDERNKKWAKYTPSLFSTLTVLDEVADKFVHGGRYLITFEHAED